MYDAIVVGGGIVGASAAFHLADNGSETLLIDREDAGRATDAGAGIVSPPTTRHEGRSWYEFSLASGKFYPVLDERLRSLGVQETGFGQPGVLVIDLADRDSELYVEGRERVFERRDRYSFPAEDRLMEVSSGEASELFPPLAETRRAIYYADGGRVDGRVLRNALLSGGEHVGVEFLHGSVSQVSIEDRTVTGVVAGGESIDATNVVIAGGAWSESFGEQLGVQIPVSPQRGQIIHLEYDSSATGEWPIVNTFYGYYFVPWSDGRVAAGATRESGVGFEPKTTVSGIHEVLTETLAMTPGLASAAISDIRVGLRPESSDGLPIVGQIPRIQGAYIATGHGPSGLTLGPFSGKCIGSLVHTGSTEVDLSAFSPSRFDTENR